ncbi:hypothetical protein UlMin_025408 [Ulmus minor]
MSKTTSDSEPLLQSSDPDPDPPPFDPTQPSVPISYPIKSLEELKSRSYFDSFHYPFNKASVPLPSGSLPNRPRMLVCHDMAGGYGDDKWVQGGSNAEAFAIWHWYLMDVFVYFSHSLVTLPPRCWTDTAHRHGVKVLGTFITESEEGRVICDTLLSTKESSQLYAERLTELAVALGFDGWLINIEVKLDLVQIPNLIEFISHLTQSMHSSISGSLVIWYDSVTTEGKLEWQDQLNQKNKPFFDICDGIFVNYTWKEDYPRLSGAVAGDRKFDVYMGIDVFGRGAYGGGQWNTSYALDLLKKEDVSAAIFAPGWIYETKQPPDFQTANNHWWALLEKSWGISQHYPRVLPFYSNFDQGHGHHFYVDGEQVLDTPWNNISSQGFQPFLKYIDGCTADPIQVFIDFKEASYSGGSNITFKGNLKDDAQFTTRLFQGELLLGDSPLYFAYSVKSVKNSLLGLALEFVSEVNERKSVLLAPQEVNQSSSKFGRVVLTRQLRKPGTEWFIQESSISMSGYKLTEIGVVCYKSKPQFRDSRLESKPDDPDENSTQGPEEFKAVLGHISIKTSEQNLYFPPSASWLVEGQHIKWTPATDESKTLSVKIIWKLKNGNDSTFSSYNIYAENTPDKVPGAEKKFLGVALLEAYYVADLVVPSGISSIKFIIQVCGSDGSSQKLEDSPYFELAASEGQLIVHLS